MLAENVVISSLISQDKKIYKLGNMKKIALRIKNFTMKFKV